MQVKKEEVRESILKAGEKEILDKGFENASIRKIVKNAGTTIGNFYNYFKNKETMFDELVKDSYIKFKIFIENHENIERRDYLWNEKNPAIWRKELRELSEYFMPIFSDRFLLLLKCSKGTKYEDIREQLINIIKEHFEEHADKLESDYGKSREFSRILAEQFVYGITLVLEQYNDKEVRQELIAEQLLFFLIGTMALLGNW